MDPNANLEQQALLLEDAAEEAVQELEELRIGLLGWLRRGGFEPSAAETSRVGGAKMHRAYAQYISWRSRRQC